MTDERAGKGRRRWLWRCLLVFLVLLIGGGIWVYQAFAWVFFVAPGAGGEHLGLLMTVIAGNGEPGFEDGVGEAVRLHKPIRLSPDGADAVVFADINNHAIRRAFLDGRVATIAGGPHRRGHLDGPAERACFDSPHGVAVRADGAIAVCEASGCTVRLLTENEQGWIVSTLAGKPGEGGMLDGPADEALFDAPHAVAWAPDGTLYVADIGNHRIRAIANGQVSTVAGGDGRGTADGGLAQGTLSWPMDIALAADGALWIADAGAARIRRWRPGVGLDTPFGDGLLAMPHGIAVAPSGHVLLAEMYGHRVLRFDPQSSEVATCCGTTAGGSGAGQLSKPAAVLAHAGHLWVADLGNHRIVVTPLPE